MDLAFERDAQARVRQARAGVLPPVRLAPPRQTFEDILRVVAEMYEMKRAEIVGPSRLSRHTEARHVALYVGRVELKFSFPKLGRLIQRDHTSVMSAVAKIERRMGESLDMLVRVRAVRRAIARLLQ